MKIKKIIYLLLLSALTACNTDKGAKVSAEFAYPDHISWAAQTQWINIYSIDPWNITIDYSSDEAWCTLSHTSGGSAEQEYTAVAIAVARNESGEERTATFHVAFPKRTISLTLTQRPQGAMLPYLEVPAYEESESRVVVTHYYTDENIKKSVRNYFVLYDTSHRLPLWVAYTLHTSTVNGNAGRADTWQYDPKVTAEGQPDLSSSYRGWYDRGHMLPSGSRQSNTTANAQTFYYTNIAPQLNGFNTGKWVDLENRLRTWKGSGQDTLYVVTGSVLQTVGGNEPIERVGSYANGAKSSSIPNYFYKACLKLTTIDGQPHYKAVGILLPHTASPVSDRLTDDEIMSIDTLEERLGIDFFVNLPDEIEEEIEAVCNRSLWGL